MDDPVQRAFETWLSETLEPAIQRHPERHARSETDSGIPVERLYLPQEDNYLAQLGFPGQYPFTRGIQPTMYRGRLWTMRQYAGFGSAAESNKRYHYLLSQGQTGLSVAFDLPTQLGYDADDPLTEGEVGKVGVSISSLADMETLLDGLPLDKISISMTINAPAAVLLAMVLAVARKQNVPFDQLRGTVQNDILKEYIARGTYIFPPHPSLRLTTDLIAYCSDHVPRWNTISISGYHIREAGSTAVQEVAFTFANAIAYVEAALAAGQDIDAFAGQLSFFFNAHNNFFEEIAKFRAARRLWARLMRERFGAKKPANWRLRFHSQTGGSTLTVQQPTNNVARVALQALAAVLGGTQSLHTNSLDEAMGLPTEDAAQIALRTQQIIAHESGVTDTIDPLGGSYYLEQLTDEVEAGAVAYLNTIDELGGALAAIEQGYIQREIQNAAYRYQQAIEQKQKIVVGINAYSTPSGLKPELLRVDESIRTGQVSRLATLRQTRNTEAVQQTLETLSRQAHQPSVNLIPTILAAVEAYATVGEICGTLRQVWGEYQPPDEI